MLHRLKIWLVLFTMIFGAALAAPGRAAAWNEELPDEPAPRSTATRRAVATPAAVRVPILMYHYVSSPGPDADRLRRELSVEPRAFEAQMRWLSDNGYTTITLDQLHANLQSGASLPEKPVVLTFDDGHIEHYSFVFPLLQSLEMTGTFFIVADFATFSYTNPDYLSWAQAREMADGGMRIESHARTHRDLRNRSFQFLVWEVLGSIEQIEAYIGRRPRFFCYPAGQFDDAVIRMLKSVDIRGAVTTVHGAQHRLSTAYTWPRIRIRYSATLAEFAALVAGGAAAAAYATPAPPPELLYTPVARPTVVQPTPTPDVPEG